MRATTLIYKVFKSGYSLFPFKKQLCYFIRILPFNKAKIYRDLKFKGPFTVHYQSFTFKLYHWQSTIENEIFWNGIGNSWEKETIPVWAELCRDAKVIIDIGANTGVYAMLAKTFSPEATVYAFEPSRNIYNKLLVNNKLNGFDIICEQLAVSEKSGSMVFYDIPDGHPTSASLSPDKLKNLNSYTGDIWEYEVQVTSLDDYVMAKGVYKVDLIKIDVELHELEVMKGMTGILKEHQPQILIEILTPEMAYRLNELLVAFDYSFYQLESTGRKLMPELKAVKPWNWLLQPN